MKLGTEYESFDLKPLIFIFITEIMEMLPKVFRSGKKKEKSLSWSRDLKQNVRERKKTRFAKDERNEFGCAKRKVHLLVKFMKSKMIEGE